MAGIFGKKIRSAGSWNIGEFKIAENKNKMEKLKIVPILFLQKRQQNFNKKTLGKIKGF